MRTKRKHFHLCDVQQINSLRLDFLTYEVEIVKSP